MKYRERVKEKESERERWRKGMRQRVVYRQTETEEQRGVGGKH